MMEEEVKEGNLKKEKMEEEKEACQFRILTVTTQPAASDKPQISRGL